MLSHPYLDWVFQTLDNRRDAGWRGGGGVGEMAYLNSNCISSQMKLKLGSGFICVMSAQIHEKAG